MWVAVEKTYDDDDDLILMMFFLQCCMIRSSTVATLLSYHTGPRPLSDALRRRVLITNFLMIIIIMTIMMRVLITNFLTNVVIKIIFI